MVLTVINTRQERFSFVRSFIIFNKVQHKTSFYVINAITIYRMAASALLLYLILKGNVQLFKWLLAISFFTDAIDGFLARKFKVTSKWGSLMDSIADDLTVLMAIIAVFVLKPDLIRQEWTWVVIMISLYLVETIMALITYRRLSSFHTYLAKTAAVLQGCFLILLFFLPQSPLFLFYMASVITILDLLEEILLIMILPQWKTDVKGLYWVMRRKKIPGS